MTSPFAVSLRRPHIASRITRWALLVLMLILASPVFAAEPKFPTLIGRVVDDAGILSPDTKSKISSESADHERFSGEQVVVVTIKSLQGYSIEDFGYQLGRHWGIGQKGTNNGVLLIVAPNERKVRIEVGYGLEGTLTDAQSRLIIEQSILPAFRRRDYNGGVLDGFEAILRVLGGNPLAEEAQAPPQYPHLIKGHRGRDWSRSPSGACSFSAGSDSSL